MKINSRKVLRLKFYLKFTKNNGEVIRYSRRTKTRVLRTIEANSFHKAYLKVIYCPDVFNHGTYYNKLDLKQALHQFTEKSLVADFKSSHWK